MLIDVKEDSAEWDMLRNRLCEPAYKLGVIPKMHVLKGDSDSYTLCGHRVDTTSLRKNWVVFHEAGSIFRTDWNLNYQVCQTCRKIWYKNKEWEGE